MAIRMKEWGMMAAPGQPVHVRTQGLYGWERVGRSMGEGISSLLEGGQELVEKVNSAGELVSFSDKLRAISDEVAEEMAEEPVQDWEYAWRASMTPRVYEAIEELSATSRKSAQEVARRYMERACIERQRDRELRRVDSSRGRWAQQVEASISAGQEEQATRWLEAGRGVFVPEEQMEERLAEARSRACHSRWESRLQAAPLEALAELSAADEPHAASALPAGQAERHQLEQSCARLRRSLSRELASQFSDALRAGEEPEPATLEQAARAGVLPAAPVQAPPPSAAPEGAASPASTLSAWCRWLDARADGEESEVAARLSIASAPLPLEERRGLLRRLELGAGVSAADRRTLSNKLFDLYQSGALGCPEDAEAQRALLDLQQEGMSLLAEQGSKAFASWVEARRAGADNWVCFGGADARAK